MFVTFFLPTFVKHSQLSHQLYRQMGAFGPENLYIIAPNYYFNEYTKFPLDHHIRQPWLQKQFYHPYPSYSEIQRFPKSVFPESMLTWFRQQYPCETILYNIIQKDIIPEFVAWIAKQIDLAERLSPVEGVLAWRDCVSLNMAARQCGVPVIYNELGPFRNPTYHETFFWDRQGLKNDSEIEHRFATVVADKRLRRQFEAWSERFFPRQFTRPTHTGRAVLLACEEDFAFMRGFSNYRLIEYAKTVSPTRPLVIRPHPLGRNVRYSDVDYDVSDDLDYVVHHCAQALTVYSNAGVELLAQGLGVDFLGDTPLHFLSQKRVPEDERQWRLGFFALNYLVPGAFMFDAAYYRWRLTAPPEAAILERHAAFWETLANDTSRQLFMQPTSRCVL